LRGGARAALGLIGDFSYRPLRVQDADTGAWIPVVQYQFFYHLSANLVLGDRLRLGVSLPFLLQMQGGHGTLTEVAGVPDVALSSKDGTGIGDLRLSADLRLLGRYGDPFTLALGATAFAATGQERNFTSDGLPRFAGRLLAAGQAGVFTYAFEGGVVRHLEQDEFVGVPFGTDLTFGAAAGFRLASGRVTIGPELFGSTVTRDAGLFKAQSTPVELSFGTKIHLGDAIRLGAAGGRGLTSGFSAPLARVLVSLEWVQPAAASKELERVPPVSEERASERDGDGDGIVDELDACPAVPGPEHPLDRSRNGCPDVVDTDHDGIADDEDACPREVGPPSSEPGRNGCPPLDSDADGISDSYDACPSVPGPSQTDPKHNGCPLDTDGDGIVDKEDACPRLAGVENANPKLRGCPRASLEGDEVALEEPIQFAPSSAQILTASFDLLDAVAEILLQHPELELVSVDGHTDKSGTARVNLQFSRARATAVVKWLVTHGVAAKRLTARGFGALVPLERNDTEAGRRKNRRVEFHVLRRTPRPKVPHRK
jgi:outer membrane protein OmpA-like peptidoglycan-associated protein